MAASLRVDTPSIAAVAGSQLRGRVVVSATQPIECVAIGVTVVGAEKVNWNFSRGPSIFRKKDEVCFSHQLQLLESPQRLGAGRERAFAFACELPLGLPGSFQLVSHVTPIARIKYVAASIEYVDFRTVHTRDDIAVGIATRLQALQLGARAVITVHEDPTGALAAAVPRDDAYLGVPVRAWRWGCCVGCRRGSFDFRIRVASDACALGAPLMLECDLHNGSAAAVTRVACRLVQLLTLQLRTREHVVEREVGAWPCADVAPNQRSVWSQAIPIERDIAKSNGDPLCPSTGDGKVIKVSHAVLTEARAPGSVDVVLRIPVALVSPVSGSGSDAPPPT